MIATEIELKLAARERDLPVLARALAAVAEDGARPRRVELVSTYFDTADHALASRGLVLRVRACDGHFVQTVKSQRLPGAPAFARGEWEDAIADAAPDRQAAATGHFLGADIAGKLVPLFRTEVVRQTIDLRPAPGSRIEAAIDRGHVAAQGAASGEAISEVELELKCGPPAALYDVALGLLAVAPVRLEWRSKAERGYRLAAATVAPAAIHAAIHAPSIELEPGLTGEAALRRIGIACLDQMLRNEPAVVADVAEGIHQMRVAVRRLRAALSAFGRLLPQDQRRWASQELRWLADALSAARNLDVFIETLLVPAAEALAGMDGLAALAEAAEHRRIAAYTEAKKAVASRRYTALLLRLLRWFEGCGWREGEASPELGLPIAAVAGGILDRRRRAAARCGKGFAHQSAPRRHRLRIALKKLRYAAELLAGLYDPAVVEPFIRRLKRLQDGLGDANDLRVAHDIVAELAAPPGPTGIIAVAGRAVIDWQQSRLARRELELREHLDRLFDSEPFWSR